MNRNLFFLMFLILSNTLFTQQVIEVCLSGDKPFTSIQAAINSTTSQNVIIRIYPGDYDDVITINNRRNWTIESLYATLADTLYIHTTRLVAEYPNRILTADNSVNLVINGLTFSNNLNGVFHKPETHSLNGGAILIRNSNVSIKNNIITENLVVVGGNVSVGATSTQPQDNNILFLQNNKIFNNKAIESGGGLRIGMWTQAVFCVESRNSIYNNFASFGKDILLAYITCEQEIYLDMGSRLISEVDYRYIDYILNDWIYPPPTEKLI